MRFFRIVRNVLLGLVAVVVLGYAGACAYANFFVKDSKPDIPTVEKARYAVQITSTGQIIFSDKVQDGGRYVTVTNYYEYDGKKFLYRKATVTLDESLFGKIDVVRRQETQGGTQ